ncbi:hypothetical protein ACFL5V_03890 [Fibrobacterota bacterium]
MLIKLILYSGLFVAGNLWGLTYEVGPDKPYEKLQDITEQLQPGDVVRVDGDASYPCGIYFNIDGTEASRITILGIRVNNMRPLLTGEARSCIEITSSYLTVKGFEITGGTKEGVGVYGNSVVLSDLVIHDLPREGILGYGGDIYRQDAPGTGDVLLEYTEIYHCGNSSNSPYAHQVYMATDEENYPDAVFRMQYCYLHDGNGGNNVKSRAGRNEIYYNWLETSVFHTLELIGIDPGDNNQVTEDTKREDSDVVGNVIFGQSGMACSRIGGDGTGMTNGRYRFVNNTCIMEGSGDVIRIFDGVESIEMHNNIFFSSSGSSFSLINQSDAYWVDGRNVSGSNNWVHSSAGSVPGSDEWTGTIDGSSPGFVNASNNDFSLASGSSLINAGNDTPQTNSTFPFIDPLFPPAYHPPVESAGREGETIRRPRNDGIDIGAYESGPPAGVKLSPYVSGQNGGAVAGQYDVLGKLLKDNSKGKFIKIKSPNAPKRK